MKLEAIQSGAFLTGVSATGVVKIIAADPVGPDAVSVTYKDSNGRLGERMLFRSDEPNLAQAQSGRPWSFDAPAADFRLGLEAYRIHLAHLFDPMMAVHTSNVQPLPHQISAVYESMLPQQPLRFVLADDPGAGKTIMAGLLVRELIMRADAKRILIVAPGGLTPQWQDELLEKFGLRFDIFSMERQEQSLTGNYFNEVDQLLVRLDQLSRNDELLDKLDASEWDLIIVDEAHKLSASFFGNEVKKTRRFLLGERLSRVTRHFLLMTATPHNGKEADFQIWLSLIDGDRFYGKFREGAHKVDVGDVMRRMVKEELLKFDGTPLFPERIARTAQYELSALEAVLYERVTDYVRNEMDRADRLDGKRKGTVGFALTQIQRRLASSPEAVFQSLRRRRQKMENRLEEARLMARGQARGAAQRPLEVPADIDDLDEELDAEAYEALADAAVDQASAAETIAEMEAEVFTLRDLEAQAHSLVQSGVDRKWEELSRLLQGTPEMFRADGSRRKLIVFSEHRDTLNYLVRCIGDLLGRPDAVTVIHGGTNRDDRRKAQEQFRNNPDITVLVATDAAGEGVNLQNANLMINYDLPWNPNRLEQRFGRIHRIGQTEICHLWNMVAIGTREGAVFKKLFDKMEIEKGALGGKVFDILGEAFDNVSLKDLLIEAIRYGDREDVKARLYQKIEGALDTEHLRDIVKRNALVDQHLTLDGLYAIKEEMEKAEARRLQPHFVKAFFVEAFRQLGGDLHPRDGSIGRFEIRHVPATIRERDRVIGQTRTPVLPKYERICFDKADVRPPAKVMADLVHPAHPLMSAVTDLILEAHRAKLKQGAVLLDSADDGVTPRMVFMVDHTVREQAQAPDGKTKEVSRRLQFVAIDEHGVATIAGWAPHLDLIPLPETDLARVRDVLEAPWIRRDLEAVALQHASATFVESHTREVTQRRHQQVDRTDAAVRERLVKEINHWSHRYVQLQQDVKAGRQPRMQPENIKRRAEELAARLEQRLRELAATRDVVSQTPVVMGGMLVIPAGLLAQRQGLATFCADAEARRRVELRAMQVVTAAEQALGHQVKDVSAEKCGWDVTARPPPNADGSIPDDRLIEVKGRAKGATTITITRNEIITALNKPDQYWLTIVLVAENGAHEGPYYLRNPFSVQPDWAVTSINLDLATLLKKAQPPC